MLFSSIEADMDENTSKTFKDNKVPNVIIIIVCYHTWITQCLAMYDYLPSYVPSVMKFIIDSKV